ncbi:glycosyltransferase family 4 protein [Ornithinimicrobium faecis]|uniref:glycosyltransferase family 4 protein n=1 Tax=Ornithinimicrobium faecis TaxID=2934158 RepID=UPI0021175396|nr:glycosyltransferase family 4 protein [Ornithinimicrobium sp. HY1793]
MLSESLRARGHRVTELGPRDISAIHRLRRLDVDLVHVHHPGRLTTALSLTPHRVPIVYTPHRTNLPRKRLLTLGHLRLLARAARVVALSPTEVALLSSDRGVDPARVALIPNGFDAAPFPFAERSAPTAGEPWTVLFVGQLIPPKQPLAIVEALDCDELRGRVRLRFVFHRERMLDELRSEVARRNLGDSVEFVGRLHGDQLSAEYSGAHFLLLPSTTLEALPSVITEAVFTGLPVIAGDVGGIRWQLDGFGECLPDINAAKLRESLIAAMSSYSSLMARAEDAAASFRSRFSVDAMVDRHLDLYESLTLHGKKG